MTSTSKQAFTAGAAKVREFDTLFEVRSEDGIRITATSWHNNSPWFPTKDQSRANVALIAEAFTIAHEIGLTPRQLAERCKELETALLAVIAIWNRTDLPNGGDAKLMYLAAHAAIAKTGGAA